MLRGIMGRLLARHPRWFNLRAFAQFFQLGFDLILRTLILLGCEAIFLNNAAALGDLHLAIAQLVMVVFGIIAFGLDGYAHAAEALVGDAMGQRDRDMLRTVINRTNVMAFASALVLSLIIWVGRVPIIGLLTNQPDLIAATLEHWHWVAVLPLASALAFQMDGVFVGAIRSRDMRNAMIVSGVFFIVLVYFMGAYGLAGLLAAFTLTLGMRGLTLWFLLPRIFQMASKAGSN
jgi:MATE family multidrug resistance protein